ncbi:MAG: ABC transporter permease [Trebonia sp.]
MALKVAVLSTGGELPAGRWRKRRPAKPNPKIPPIRGFWIIIAVLVIWQLVHSQHSAYYPAPSEWWSAVTTAWDSGKLGSGLRATALTFVLGIVLSTIIGSALGILIGRVHWADRMLGPILEYCRVLPAPVTVPIAVLFGGYSQETAVTVVVFSAIWPILLQVRTSAQRVPPEMLEMSHMLRFGVAERVRKVILPGVAPGIVLGLRGAAPLILISTLLVELLTNMKGLGSLLLSAQDAYDSALVYGLIVILGILGVLLNMVIALAETRLRTRWR